MFLKDALLAKHVFMDSPVLAPSILSENDAAKRILDFGNFLPLNWIKRPVTPRVGSCVKDKV